MDVLGPLSQLLFRALFVVLPLTISWLAFRRVMRSRSANAWIYATTCLFTSVIAAGLVPWTLGVGSASWLFFMFSALSPVIWMGVVMICDPVNRASYYDTEDVDEVTETLMFSTHEAAQNDRPLILEQPKWPEAPVPVFRHKKPVAEAAAPREENAPRKTLLSVAKGMRGNDSSEPRRPRLLPAPDRYGNDLPFLHRN